MEEGQVANMYVTFLYSEGWNDNTLYYYTYSADETLTKEQILDRISDETKLFGPWNSYPYEEDSGKGASNYRGVTKQLAGTFKNDDCIGFVLKSCACWDNADAEDYYVYSMREHNNNKGAQVARFVYEKKALVYTVEDEPVYKLKKGKWDKQEKDDYNDFVFIVTADPQDAITDPEIPDLPTPPYYLTSTGAPQEGTLLFEDLYPSQGDYDMNDFVVKYSLTETTSILYDPDAKEEKGDRYLEKVDCQFRPVWDGANYGHTFSFMLDGYKDVPTEIYTLEANNDKGALEVDVVSKTLEFPFVVDDNNVVTQGTVVKDGKWDWSVFNPFVTVQNSGYEVHLSKMKPSANAKKDGLDEWALQYATKGNYPYAMNIPILDYQVVEETQPIDKFYPKYTEWVEGNHNIDWYNYPANKE